LHWSSVTLAYVSYLTLTAFARPRFRQARSHVVLAAAVTWGVFVAAVLSGTDPDALSTSWQVVLPALLLLVGYWLSGLFFIRPQPAVEAWLLRLDRLVLARIGTFEWSRALPRLLLEYLELNYLLVYALLPAGALVVALAGEPRDLARFWAVVLLAEFTCYAVLPWVQTRPPRVIEAASVGPPALGVRRLNMAIAARASIQANTLPSGHAAGAVAAALCVAESSQAAGVVFTVMAVGISIATFVGRYHYLVDSILGALVAVTAWAVIR
jgi:hypothetical protein